MRVKPWIVFNKNANEQKEYSWIENRKIIFSLIHTIFAIFFVIKKGTEFVSSETRKKDKKKLTYFVWHFINGVHSLLYLNIVWNWKLKEKQKKITQRNRTQTNNNNKKRATTKQKWALNEKQKNWYRNKNNTKTENATQKIPIITNQNIKKKSETNDTQSEDNNFPIWMTNVRKNVCVENLVLQFCFLSTIFTVSIRFTSAE